MTLSSPRLAAALPAGILALLAGLSLACGSESAPTGPASAPPGIGSADVLTVRDLAAEFHRATSQREVAAIDFGEPAARSHLGRGWSWDERQGESTFAWGLGSSSVVEFHLSAPRDLTAILAGFAYSYPGAPPQRVTVELNGERIAEFAVGAKRGELSFRLPENVLRAGRNELRLRYAHSARPAAVTRSRDRRPLAVAWESLRFTGLTNASPPRASTAPPRLFLPFGSEVSYFLELGNGAAARLEAAAVRQRAAGRLEVIWQAGGESIETESWPLALANGVVVGNAFADAWYEPGGAAPRPVRLTLRAVAAALGTASGRSAERGILLESPVLRRREPSRPPSAGAVAPVNASGERLNVVLYLVDTLRADRLGAYGGPSPSPSPRLDRFAAEGVLFEHAVAQTSWTKPAVASILTGLGPIVHGVHQPEDALPTRALTLAEILAAAGYRTAGFVANAHLQESSGLAQGFERWDYRFDVPARDLDDPALDWLDQHDGEPFFLYLHAIDPHAPYAPRAPFRQRFAADIDDPAVGTVEHIRSLPGHGPPAEDPETAALLALYDAEIAQNDAAFGELLDALDARRLGASTLVVFLSDHGEAFREHGVLGHGWDLHGETLNVPWVMRWPGGPRGLRVREAVQHVDLVPTLLALLGLEVPAGLDGRDLAPLMAGGALVPTPVFSHLDYAGRRGMSVVYRGRKLIEPLGGGFARDRQLYRLDEDPLEINDLAVRREIWSGYLGSLAAGELARSKAGLEPRRDVIDEARRRELEALGYLR